MKKITEYIAGKTSGTSFKTNTYSLDGNPRSIIDYEEAYNNTPSQCGETIRHTKPVDISKTARDLENQETPLFKYFLDGSRRTYRVSDIIYERNIFPVIAGQIGVGCCRRENRQLKKETLEINNVIVLPGTADKDGSWRDNFFE
jgi:hypothetical protein